MTEIVSAWSDDRSVFLVSRDGENVSCRRLPARWSAWLRGLSDDDRRTLQRTRDVVSATPEGELTRIDFRSKWARIEVTQRIRDAIKSRKMSVSLAPDDEFDPNDPIFSAGVLEADVNPLRRLLSDVPSIQVSASPRLAYLDLETDSRQRFDVAVDGRARVLSWAVELFDGTRASAVLEADTDDAERALLAKLMESLERADCVLAWNGDAFDFLVLENRLMRLKVRVRGKVPEWRRWCWLDQMETFKKYNQAHESGEERTSFALDAIARHLLGEGKASFDSRRTWEAWEAGGDRRAELLRYNERDVALMPRIEAKTGFVALHLAVCAVTRCLPDSASLGAAQQGDGYMLALGAARGWRFPSRPDYDENHAAFAGAYVMEPRRLGAIDDIHVCDFAGLYPSIMRTWNMSPDTLLDRDVGRSSSARARLPHKEVYFRTDRRGLFPLALDQIVAERARYTKIADAAEPGSEEWTRYRRLSSAYKIVANSFYGIVGSPFTRFFDREIAEGVAQTGAWLIKHVADASTHAGLEPFYGDTDSIFVAGDPERFRALVGSLNASWPSIAAEHGATESYVKLEYEKSFRRMVLVSAKRYAARYSLYKGKPAPADMKPEVKGLEYKRGDSIRLARELQYETIGRLLADGPIPTSAEMRSTVDAWRERVLRGEIAVDDVVLSQSVKDLDEYRERFTSARCTGKVATGVGKKTRPCGYDYGSTTLTRAEPEEPEPEVDEEGREVPRSRSRKKQTEPERGEEVELPIVEATVCPRCRAARKIASAPVHVRVARKLAARGEQVVAGTRVEYLVVRSADDETEESDEKMNAVPARDEGALERIDRDYYWDKRVWPPTQRLLEAVYPGVEWADTASRRRRAEKAVAVEATRRERRGKVEDLPLFGSGGPGPVAASVEAFTRVNSESAEAVLARRARRMPQDASDSPDASQPRIVVRVGPAGSGERGRAVLVAVRAAVEASPGVRPVFLVVDADGASATVPTGLGGSGSAEMVRTIEGLLGAGSVDA